ncbi:MAG TPA: iron chelate uptake ABC transporter family permease subunit [Dehalococcoidia bacterium]|nr:iron chelate uptake ABC transporter family permease subunit [Dehalococcoidia bacterium]
MAVDKGSRAEARVVEQTQRVLHPLRRRWGVLMLALAAAGGVMLFSSSQGPVAIPVETLVRMLLAKLSFLGFPTVAVSWPATHEAVFFQVRLPRVVLAGLVGACLAAAGAAYQGLFRNPLADPYLIGVASGASLGAVLALVLPLAPLFYSLGAVQLMAFAGALVTVAAVYGLARVGGTVPVSTLLLAGVALGAFASAVTSFLMYLHGDKLVSIYSWLLGGFSLGDWSKVMAIIPYAAVGLAFMGLHGRVLNVLQLDEEQAAQLGLPVERLKIGLIAAATLVTAAAVSVSGLIGFAGLIVPHAVRLVWGPDYRFLLPMSILMGAAFLVLADTLARTVLGATEIPVGAVTAFVGAPFFLYLLRQKRRAVF